ncbi:hypothetical protein MKZ38_002994 [Zalerion maritima]|uniref:Uncharacterized protein n=1 Tax=Zalerion maritima TaxID=339359 RepID=A0AAD5RPE5_9PEZI|nr:hypothetical protein MKZ38_002994 [Zalerion maritima]
MVLVNFWDIRQNMARNAPKEVPTKPAIELFWRIAFKEDKARPSNKHLWGFPEHDLELQYGGTSFKVHMRVIAHELDMFKDTVGLVVDQVVITPKAWAKVDVTTKFDGPARHYRAAMEVVLKYLYTNVLDIVVTAECPLFERLYQIHHVADVLGCARILDYFGPKGNILFYTYKTRCEAVGMGGWADTPRPFYWTTCFKSSNGKNAGAYDHFKTGAPLLPEFLAQPDPSIDLMVQPKAIRDEVRDYPDYFFGYYGKPGALPLYGIGAAVNLYLDGPRPGSSARKLQWGEEAVTRMAAAVFYDSFGLHTMLSHPLPERCEAVDTRFWLLNKTLAPGVLEKLKAVWMTMMLKCSQEPEEGWKATMRDLGNLVLISPQD